MKRWKILKKLWLPFVNSGIDRHSATACFYILLSALPATALGLTAFSVFSLSEKQWIILFSDLLPERFLPVLHYVFSSVSPRQPISLVSLWAILTLWSAAKGIMALTSGISDILQVDPPSGFIRRRLFAMVILILLLFVFAATSIIFVFSKSLFIRLRHLYSAVLLTALISSFYAFLPGRPLPFVACVKCGSLSSAGWLLTSSLFSIYVNHFQSYQQLYGGLGLLVLGCLWLKLSLSVLLYSVLWVKLRQNGAYRPIQILKNALF